MGRPNGVGYMPKIIGGFPSIWAWVGTPIATLKKVGANMSGGYFKIFLSFLFICFLAGCSSGKPSLSAEDQGDRSNSQPPVDRDANQDGGSTFRVVSLGDSLSLGTMADSNSLDLSLLGLILQLPGTDHNFALNHSQFNWATGESLGNGINSGSHLNRLENLFPGTQVNGFHLGIVGLQANGGISGKTLLGQTQQAAALKPHYVTLLIGAMDLCNGNLAAPGFAQNFANKVEESLNALVLTEGLSPLVLVSSLPPIDQVIQIGQNVDLRRHSSCASLLAQACPNSANAVAFSQAQTDLNSQLERLSTQPKYQGKVIFDSQAVSQGTINPATDIAIDCFHPSKAGQNNLSQKLWDVVKDRF